MCMYHSTTTRCLRASVLLDTEQKRWKKTREREREEEARANAHIYTGKQIAWQRRGERERTRIEIKIEREKSKYEKEKTSIPQRAKTIDTSCHLEMLWTCWKKDEQSSLRSRRKSSFDRREHTHTYN